MKNPSSKLRDKIVDYLKQDKDYKNTVTVEQDGVYIALADIAKPAKNGGVQAFRILVIPHMTPKA